MSTAEERRWYEAVASLEFCVLCGRHGVQVAHSNQDRGKSQKSPPWMTAPLCAPNGCHHEIDNGKELSQAERRALMDRAIKLTHDALIRAGKLRLAP